MIILQLIDSFYELNVYWISCILVIMDKNKPATDIDRKLAIYYHPLFQEVIKNILLLFNIPQTQPFEIGLI